MAGVKTRNKSVNSAMRHQLMTCLERDINTTPLFDPESFEEGSLEEKLDQVIEAMEKLNERFVKVHNIVNDAQDGIDTRLEGTSAQVLDSQEKIQELEEENQQLRFELDLLKSLIYKHSADLTSLRDKTTSCTAQKMSLNLTIQGILGDCENFKDDNCKGKVSSFLKDTMKLEIAKENIVSAYRQGPYKKDQNRSIIVKCKDKATKVAILKNKNKLKDVKNDKDMPYYINKQLPEAYVETNREIREIIKVAKKKAKDAGQDIPDIKVKERKVYVNKQPQIKALQIVKPQDLFVDKAEQEKLDKIKFYHSDTKTDQGSAFTGFVAKCSNITEARRAYVKIKQLYTDADHIIAAFTNRNTTGYQDDREFGAGHKLLKTIQDQQTNNIAVYVVRRFGGKLLGAARHDHIKQVALEALAKIP